jgi:4'-phosphopantetheinyl transferase
MLKKAERLHSKELSETDVLVACGNLAGAAPASVEMCARLLSEDERQRAERFAFPALRQKYVLSRGLLRSLLGELLEIAAGDLTFAYGESGKPSLSAVPRAIEFNMSHSGDMVAYAFTKTEPVGVDIEHRRDLKDLEGIAKRFFAPAEYEEMISLDTAARPQAFFNGWTRKEAYIKALGRGLSLPLDSFRVSLRPGENAALLDVRDNPNEAQQWTIREFSPAEDYCGAIAVRVQNATVRFLEISIPVP